MPKLAVVTSVETKISEEFLYPISTAIQDTVFSPKHGKITVYLYLSTMKVPYLLAADLRSQKYDFTEDIISFSEEKETIGILVLQKSNTDELTILRKRFDKGGFESSREIEYFKSSEKTNKQTSFEDFLPITEKLEDIFFEIHSCMRDVDGLHADEALEELCKLIYLKLYYEETHSKNSQRSIFHLGQERSTEELAANLRHIYREAVNSDIRTFQLRIPMYARSRGVFGQPLRLSSAALYQCFKLLEHYSLLQSKADIKGRAFQKVLDKAMRSGMGQYFTPAQVCDLMVSIMKPGPSDLVLDPFCGSGHFLSQSLRYVSEHLSISDKRRYDFAFSKLHGIEKSERMTRIAMTDMRLNGDGHSNIRCVDALLEFKNYPDLHSESFDIVLTNPPFGSLLSQEAISTLGSFELTKGHKRVPLEVLGLERAIQFLCPGGRIAIVLPDGIFTGDSFAYVREWLALHVKIRAVIGLPIETFVPFGASVNTSILLARKWLKGEAKEKTYNVQMMRIDNIGYDATGKISGESEVEKAVMIITKFLDKEGW